MMTDKSALSIEIVVSKDYYEANLTMNRPKGIADNDVHEKIREALRLKNVVYGVDYEAITLFVADGTDYVDRVIAHGLVHVNGSDAYMTPQVNFEGVAKPIIQDDGTVDFKNLLQVSAVKMGDVLSIKTPAKEGEDGITVTGKPVKHKPGKDAIWKIGENVKIGEDGNEVLSEIDGIAKIMKDRITVSQHIEISEVGPATGNIYFGGDVLVKGNVLGGYTVHCDGDLQIQGFIEGAIIMTKGNLLISGGINGHGVSDIVVGGNLTAKFIENANLYVKGEIETGEIINSKVLCDNKIVVKGKKGLIIGGEITSKYMIEANQIGSKLGVITSINLGVDASAIHELKELKESIQSLLILKERLKAKIPMLKRNVLIQPEVGVHEDLLKQHEDSLLSILIQLEEKQDRQDELMDALRNVNQGKVKINNIHPDTVIRIGDSKYVIDKSLSACVFSKVGDQVIAIGLEKPQVE